jgi:hypothetical protein
MTGSVDFVRGTYSDPRSFWATGARLDEYGVNAIFVHSGSIDADLVARAKSEGAKVFAEFATLNGKGYVDEHPEAWPVDERGEPSPSAGWFMGACPTEPGFRAYRLRQLRDLLEAHDLDGVFMDYLHWHAHFEDPEPVLPETCFSESCLADFSRATGLAIPRGNAADRAEWILGSHDREWRDWRCSVLADWTRSIRNVIEAVRPGIKLGNLQCGWRDDDFGGARRRTLGLDIELLSPLLDVISPNVFHGRMGRPPAWVRDAVSWLCGVVGPASPRVWPVVQAGEFRASYRQQVIPAEEFRDVMNYARAGGASGVMMFYIEAVAADPAKMEVMRDLYTSWAKADALR